MFNKKMLTGGASEPAEPTTIAEEKAYFAEVGESAYEWTTSASDRQFARCKCDHGTIMKWNDVGTTRYTIVLDAKYRTKAALYTNNSTNLGLTNFTSYGFFTPSGSSVTTLPKAAADYTDTRLNSNTYAKQDTRGSTVATNEWQNSSYYGTNMAAAYYVRNTLASNEEVGAGCDMPTINCLTRIFGDMSLLDSMDPTVSSYTSYRLASWFTFDDFVWSSSWYGNNLGSYYGLRVRSNGIVVYRDQNGSLGVVPVLEIG